MKRWLLLLIVLIPVAVRASDGGSFTLASGIKVTDNYVQVGNVISVDGDVTGDVIVAGSDVTVRGHVGGDVLVVGNHVRVLGPVDGNVRAAGNDIEIANTVGKNVTIAGSALTLTKDGVVNGTFSAAGATLSLAGTAKHQVDAAVGEVTVSGVVDGDLRLQAGEGQSAVRLSEGAKIGGMFRYTAAHEAQISSGVTIGGPTVYTAKAAKSRVPFQRTFHVYQTAVKFFGLVLLGLILLGIAKKFTNDVVEVMAQRPGRSTLYGVFALVGVPIVILFFLLTLIGIPVALLLGAVYMMAFLVSSVMVSLRVGMWLVSWLSKSLSPTWVLMLGTFVTLLVVDGLFGGSWMDRFPLLGLVEFLLRLFLVLWSMGALTMVLWSRARSSSTPA